MDETLKSCTNTVPQKIFCKAVTSKIRYQGACLVAQVLILNMDIDLDFISDDFCTCFFCFLYHGIYHSSPFTPYFFFGKLTDYQGLSQSEESNLSSRNGSVARGKWWFHR